MVADDAVEHAGALDDAGNLAAKAKVAKSGPVGGKYALRVTTGEGGEVKPGEGFFENGRFDQLADQRGARALAVSDCDADTTHDFTVVGERLAKAARTAGELDVPRGRRRVVAILLDDGKSCRGTLSAALFQREHTTANAEWL